MARGKAALLTWAVVGASLAFLVISCGAFLGVDDDTNDAPPPPGEDAASDSPSGDANDPLGDATQPLDGAVASSCADAGGLDLVGCPCDVAGSTRPCYRGSPGPKSACTMGQQACASGAWTSCVGGTSPSTETCYDDLDNDCNGVVDDGCRCSGTVPVCPSGAVAVHVRVDPNKARFGEKIHIIVSSKTPGAMELVRAVAPDLQTTCLSDPSVGCDVGPSCAGWFARRLTYTAGAGPFAAMGNYQVTVRNGTDFTCTTGPIGNIENLQITP